MLDLHAVEFLDASALRLIVEWDAIARTDRFSFVIAAGPARVWRLFELTGLTDRLCFVDGDEGRPATAAARI